MHLAGWTWVLLGREVEVLLLCDRLLLLLLLLPLLMISLLLLLLLLKLSEGVTA